MAVTTPAAALAAQQARMAQIVIRQTFWINQQTTNQANAALIQQSLDQIAVAIKDCQSKIDTANFMLGNATNADPPIP